MVVPLECSGHARSFLGERAIARYARTKKVIGARDKSEIKRQSLAPFDSRFASRGLIRFPQPEGFHPLDADTMKKNVSGGPPTHFAVGGRAGEVSGSEESSPKRRTSEWALRSM